LATIREPIRQRFSQKSPENQGCCAAEASWHAASNKALVAWDVPECDAKNQNLKNTQTFMTTMTQSPTFNGINTDLLRGAVEAITNDPAKAMTHWEVTTHWRGGTRSDTHVTRCVIGGEEIAKDFTIKVDEPLQLCGTAQYANPQEYLLASLNACMIVGYSACCAHEGIELSELRIETEGDIDLRGFLGLDATVKPGYDQLRYTVYIKGKGTPEQFEKIHRSVMTTSPNYFNISSAVPLQSRLVVK
jgi:uncharacterized OsmC-like protein